MALIAYNLTAAPLVLAAGNPVPTLKASPSVGVRGQGFDVTVEILGLAAANYTALQAQQDAGSVQYEWTDLPEYNTFSLVAGSAQTDVFDTDLEIYADAVTGNDANPGTPTLKVKTWDKAFSLMSVGRKRRRIFLAAGTYPIPAGNYVVPPALGSVGEPVSIIGDNVIVETNKIGAIVSDSRIFTRDVAAAPQVGAALTITNGTAMGRRLLIAFDDGLTITLLDRVGSGLVAGTTTFTIERPATNLDIGANFVTFTGAAFALKNVKFTGAGAPALPALRFADQANCVSIENVDIDTDKISAVVTNFSVFRTASDDTGFLSPNPFSRALRRSCGVYLHGVAFGFFVDGQSNMGQAQNGGIVLNDSAIVLDSGSVLVANAPAPCGTKAAIVVNNGSNITLNNSQSGSIRGIFEDSTAPGTPVIIIGALSSSNSIRGGAASIRRVAINNSRGDAIRANQQSTLYADSVVGANNAGFGIRIDGLSGALSNTTTAGLPLGSTTCSVTGRNGVALSTPILDNPLSAVAVTVNVASTAGFPAAGAIKIDNEIIRYTGVTVGPDAFTGCTRGSDNTVAASHLVGALASQASGADTLIGATPKQYGAINGTPAFAELFAGMPTGNAFGIRQS